MSTARHHAKWLSLVEVSGSLHSVLLPKLYWLGFGSRHDRRDAFLSAWTASLDATMRYAYGNPPLDAIWVPATRSVL